MQTKGANVLARSQSSSRSFSSVSKEYKNISHKTLKYCNEYYKHTHTHTYYLSLVCLKQTLEVQNLRRQNIRAIND